MNLTEKQSFVMKDIEQCVKFNISPIRFEVGRYKGIYPSTLFSLEKKGLIRIVGRRGLDRSLFLVEAV